LIDNNEIFQKVNLENQFEAKKIDTFLQKCSESQLHDMALFYATSLLYQQQELKNFAKNLAKGEKF